MPCDSSLSPRSRSSRGGYFTWISGSLICGAGPIGLITLIVCHAARAYPIVITDIDQSRLDFDKTIMPNVLIDRVEKGETTDHFAAAVNRLLVPDTEIAIALECTGVESSVCSAIQTVKFGGKIFMIGVRGEKMQTPFMRCSAQEVERQFQQRYVNMWPRAIRVLRDVMVDLKRLITHEFTLENAVDAFKTAVDPMNGSIKVIIRH